MFNRNPPSVPPSDPPGVSSDLGIPNLRPDGPPIREISPSSQEINEPAEVIVSRVLFALLISASLVSIRDDAFLDLFFKYFALIQLSGHRRAI